MEDVCYSSLTYHILTDKEVIVTDDESQGNFVWGKTEKVFSGQIVKSAL